jgi:hypothetical protein
MDKDGPATIQVDDDPSRWQATQVDDVFLPAVRVCLGWHDVEKAVELGAVVPAHAHALWAGWAAPGSPLRQSAATQQKPIDFQPTVSDFPAVEDRRDAAPSMAARLGGPLAGAAVGAVLTWLAVGG